MSLSLLNCCALTRKLSLIHCLLLVCLEVEFYEQAQEKCEVHNEQDAEKPRMITL